MYTSRFHLNVYANNMPNSRIYIYTHTQAERNHFGLTVIPCDDDEFYAYRKHKSIHTRVFIYVY